VILPYSVAILGPRFFGYKRASLCCLQSVHSLFPAIQRRIGVTAPPKAALHAKHLRYYTSMSTAASVPGVPAKRGGFSRVWRTLKQLFHEVTGAIFAVLAFAWLNAAIRALTHDTAYWLVAVAGIVAASFTFFALTSFRLARKL
jgi:hypothetical protein